MEDAEVQANSVIMNSLVGWNVKIGPWCRIEGTLYKDEKNKVKSGQKFDVCVLGVGSIIFPECMIRNSLVMPFIKVKQNQSNKIIF